MFQLELPATAKIHNTFHVSLLKKRIGHKDTTSASLPPIVVHSDSLFPEQILDRWLLKKNNAAGVTLLIKWKGRVPEDATWEDYDDIKSKFPDFLDEDVDSQERGNCHK